MSASLVRRVLQEKRAFIWPLAVLLVANVVAFLATIRPLAHRVAAADARAAAAAAELAAARREEDRARRTVAGKARAEQDLERFYREILPADHAAARRLTYPRLAELAQAHGLRFTHRRFAVERDRGSRLERLEAEMAIEGAYADMRDLIDEIETTPEFVVITGIELAQRQQPNDPLQLTLRLATYYRAPDDGR
jgi:Tfp pilus assembly protein PilO